MSDQKTYRRRTSRVLLIDGADRVLLLKHLNDPDDPATTHIWFTPGGGVEKGESLAQAAARELGEEIGLSVTPGDLGPQIGVASGYADLGWTKGLFQDNFYHYRVEAHEVDLSGLQKHELRHHAGYRWWSPAEIAASTETIYPYALAGLTAELTAGRIPRTPVQLPWHH
jgi:8-oxo-dGTP pyrophosphatase MutT (NUDIX family)